MTWPVASIDTTQMDSDTDSPLLARAEIKKMADQVNEMRENGAPIVGIKMKILSFAAWNMNTNSFRYFAHGLTLSKIRGASAVIVNDEGTSYSSFPMADHTATSVERIIFNESNVVLYRGDGGLFAVSSSYSGVGLRGYVTIYYVD